MPWMIRNLLGTFFRKGLYGFIGNVVLALLAGTAITPTGNAVDVYLWHSLGVGAFTGLAALLKRLMVWDPAKDPSSNGSKKG